MSLKRIELSKGEKLLYPSKPTVVTVKSGDRIGGMLASWWTQLSFNPFLIGVAVGYERFTYRLLDSSESFGLNFIGFEYVDKAPYLGDISERFFRNKIEKGGFKIFYGDVLNVPLIGDSYLAVELKVFDRVEAGDHELFIGEAKALYARPDMYDDNFTWKLNYLKPLFYMGRVDKQGTIYRRYATWVNATYKDIELAPRELKEAHRKRYKVRKEIFSVLKKFGEIDYSTALEIVADILRKNGVDVKDAKYYVLEAVKAGNVKIKGVK